MHLFRLLNGRENISSGSLMKIASKCLSKVQFTHSICRAVPAVGRIHHHHLKALELKFATLRMQILAGTGLPCRGSRTDGGTWVWLQGAKLHLMSLCQPEWAAAAVTCAPKPLPDLQIALPPHCKPQSRAHGSNTILINCWPGDVHILVVLMVSPQPSGFFA